jgi:hypothetical protein
MKVKGEKKQGKNLGVYLTPTVYKLWRERISAKELAMFMYPEKNLKADGKYAKGDFVLITFRMPVRWVEWYQKLSREEKFAFASLVEKRLREAGIL